MLTKAYHLPAEGSQVATDFRQSLKSTNRHSELRKTSDVVHSEPSVRYESLTFPLLEPLTVAPKLLLSLPRSRFSRYRSLGPNSNSPTAQLLYIESASSCSAVFGALARDLC